LSRQRLRTNLTFGAAKTQIAQQASKQNTTEFLARAGTALQKAVQYWNRYNWRYLLKQAPDFSVTAGDGTLDIPWDLKDIYSLRIESNGRKHALVNTNRRLYDRVINDPAVRGEPYGYDMAADGSGNVITITPPPDTESILRLKYYRRMWVPCHVSGVKATMAWAHPNTVLTADGVATLCTFDATETVFSSGTPVDGYAAMADVTLGSPVSAYIPPAMASATSCSHFGWELGISPVAEYPVYTGFNPLGINSQQVKINVEDMYPTAPSGNIDPTNTVPIIMTFGGDNHVLDMPVDFEDGILAKATAHFLAGLGAPEGRLAYFLQKAEDELQEARRFNEEQEDQDTSFEIGAPPPPLGRFRSNGWV
jgi:hypothetical protein